MQDKSLNIILPLPPSLNKARIPHKIKKGNKFVYRLIDSSILREWKKNAKEIVEKKIMETPKWMLEHVENKGTFIFQVKWIGNHWCKNGNARRRDTDNRVKFLMDIIYKQLKIDDSYSFNINLTKIHCPEIETESCYCSIIPFEPPIFNQEIFDLWTKS